VWFDLPSGIIAGEEIAMNLCFFKGRLSMITCDLRRPVRLRDRGAGGQSPNRLSRRAEP
jgi:hypothetical protein